MCEFVELVRMGTSYRMVDCASGAVGIEAGSGKGASRCPSKTNTVAFPVSEDIGQWGRGFGHPPSEET